MDIEIIATKREGLGTGASRRLRRAGHLPAIVYGAGKEPESIVLEHNPIFYALKNEAFHTAILNLLVDGQKQAVLLRDFQMHPYKPQVLHIDFQRVDLHEKMHLKVPLHFINGELSEAVKLQGAKISHVVNEVDVRALPAQLPQFIEVDLSQMKAGQSIHLSNLTLPAGVEITALARGDDSTVAFATAPKLSDSAE